MKSTLRFGIVIPSFERLAYLQEALTSALNQTYTNLEILVVDDHSKNPELRTYLKNLASPLLRVIINGKNLGTTANYDKCVRSLPSAVRWCVILDNDDILDKNFVEEAVRVIKKFPGSNVLHARQLFIDGNKRLIGKDGPYPSLESSEEYLIRRCLNQREIRTSAMIFRPEKFKEIGGYPPFPSGLGTDTVLLFALAFGNALAYAPKAKVRTRLYAGAESGNTKNLIGRLVSIRMMLPYCRSLYRSHPKHDSRNKRKVLLYLSFYSLAVSLFVLVGRCKELAESSPAKMRQELRRIRLKLVQKELVREAIFIALISFVTLFGVGIPKKSLAVTERVGNSIRRILRKLSRFQ